MDIAGVASALARNKSLTDVGTAMLAKSLDQMEVEGAGIVSLIQTADQAPIPTPGVGQNFDMSV